MFSAWYNGLDALELGVESASQSANDALFSAARAADATSDKDLIRYTDRFFDQGVPFDYYWLDAGWYPCQVPGQEHNAWPYVGTWKFAPKRFPHGLRPASDHIRGKGAKVLVWFEPERVTPGSELAVEHPDWILGGSLLNLGKPDARNWITKRILTLLVSTPATALLRDFSFGMIIVA